MKGVDHSEVKKTEESCIVCVSRQKARREAGFAVLFSLPIKFLIPGYLLLTVSQCLFHPYIILDLGLQPHTPEQVVTASVFMQRQTLVTSGTEVLDGLSDLLLAKSRPSSSLRLQILLATPSCCRAGCDLALPFHHELRMFMPGNPESFTLCVTPLLPSSW